MNARKRDSAKRVGRKSPGPARSNEQDAESMRLHDNFVQFLDVGPENECRSPSQLAEVEASLIVHLALYDGLGCREGVAIAYEDLGKVYEALSHAAAAADMFSESSRLKAALARGDRRAR